MSTKRLWRTPTAQEAGARVETLYTKDGQPAKVGERAYRKTPKGELVLQSQTINQQIQMDDPRQDSPQSTFLLEGSPASPSLLPGSEAARQTTASSGRRCLESYRYSNRHGYSLRTLVASLLSTTDWSSSVCYLTWREKATKSSRLLFQLAPSTPRTGAIGCGLWPTPQAADSAQGAVISEDDRFVTLPSGRLRRINRNGVDGSCGLAREVVVKMWPTPHGNCHTGAGEHGTGARNLQTAVLLPTPKGRDWKGQTQRGIHAPQDGLQNMDNGDGKLIGGQLNPEWVTWLMGYPPHWTDIGTENPTSRESQSESKTESTALED